VDRACDLHRILDLVPVLDELSETPGADVELFLGQVLVGVQRFEDREADAELGEVFGGGHASLFRRLASQT
jgi:hypothetical protein